MVAAVLSSAAVLSPTAPTQVVATASPGQIQLSWTPPVITQAPVITYLISIDDETTGATSAPMASSAGAQPSDTIAGLTAGDSFAFTVQARTTDGDGQPSQPSNTVVAIASTQTTTTTFTPSPKPGPQPPAASKPTAAARRHLRPHRPRHAVSPHR